MPGCAALRVSADCFSAWAAASIDALLFIFTNTFIGHFASIVNSGCGTRVCQSPHIVRKAFAQIIVHKEGNNVSDMVGFNNVIPRSPEN